MQRHLFRGRLLTDNSIAWAVLRGLMCTYYTNMLSTLFEVAMEQTSSTIHTRVRRSSQTLCLKPDLALCCFHFVPWMCAPCLPHAANNNQIWPDSHCKVVTEWASNLSTARWTSQSQLVNCTFVQMYHVCAVYGIWFHAVHYQRALQCRNSSTTVGIAAGAFVTSPQASLKACCVAFVH